MTNKVEYISGSVVVRWTYVSDSDW